MWKKRIDYHMGDVYFTNEYNGRIRELRFAFNTCIDSTYNTVGDFKTGNKCNQNVIKLAEDFTKYISCQERVELTNELEKKIINSDFYFEIPDKFLKN